jgi:hypothetical protein
MNILDSLAAERNSVAPSSDTIDPRLAFLIRASARWYLVEHGEMDLGDAFDGLVRSLKAVSP